MDHVIAGKFKLGRKIGSGSFGELYLGMREHFLFLGFLFVFSVFFFLQYYLVLLLPSLKHMFLLFMLAVNVQTGEEVAVKLVCYVSLNFSLLFVY